MQRGDRLCFEIDILKQSPKITTEPIKTTSSECSSNSIQLELSCLNFNINGAKVKGSTFDKTSGSTTIQVHAINDGNITISAKNSLLDTISMILVDGEEWDDVIVDGSKMTIDFFAGTETIEIIWN